MAGTGSCCNISCCDPLTNFVDEKWNELRESVITLKDGVKRSVVYIGVEKFFECAKQTTSTFEGWKKLAAVIKPLAELTLQMELDAIAEPFEVLHSQFETFKLLDGGLAWIGVGNDLFKKEWIENPKSKNSHGENYVAAVKRVVLIAMNSLKLVTFGGKLGIIAEVSLNIGNVSVMSILAMVNSGLGLIGNSLTLWTNYVDDSEVNDKIARFLDDANVTPEKIADLKAKLLALSEENKNIVIEDSDSDSDSDLTSSEQEGETGAVRTPMTHDELADWTYAHLKMEIAYEKALKKQASTFNNLTAKRELINESNAPILIEGVEETTAGANIKELKDKRSALIIASAKVAAEHLACKADVRALRDISLDNFKDYKIVQFKGRLADLEQQRTKTWIDIGCNVVSLVGHGLGVGKAYFGMKAIMDVLDIEEELPIKMALSAWSLLTGSSELAKFLYDENHKAAQGTLRISEYADILNVA